MKLQQRDDWNIVFALGVIGVIAVLASWIESRGYDRGYEKRRAEEEAIAIGEAEKAWQMKQHREVPHVPPVDYR